MTDACRRVLRANYRPKGVDLCSLLFYLLLQCLYLALLTVDSRSLILDLLLLLLDRVYQKDPDTIVFDSLPLPCVVVCDEQRFDGRNVFSTQAEIVRSTVSPIESYRFEPFDQA